VSHPRAGVTIVTRDSQRYIERCLEAVLRQAGVEPEIVVVDNDSRDGTRDLLRRYSGRARIIKNSRNLGFAAAQNQAIAATAADWVLTLNPDVLLAPGAIRRLVDAGEADPSAGSVCGRLLSIGPGFTPLSDPLIDSAGIYFTPAMRHFDRGWHEPDDGRYRRPEYVFGASAAAALYRRGMIDELAEDDEFFDPDFFVYREDADVAWRAQLLGWRCLYTPHTVGHHVRTVTPANRRAVPAVLNMHSVKNRFLMRIKNTTPGLWRRYWRPMLYRDALVMGACLLWEPTSLAAFWRVARCLPRALGRRRRLMDRRRVSDAELARWFSQQPEIDLHPRAGEHRPAVAVTGAELPAQHRLHGPLVEPQPEALDHA
jgi:GT2 family glycosyltransferase